MSCFFRIGNNDVWNPSNLVAKVFVEQVATLSHLTHMDSGVGAIVDDECEIDCIKFSDFTISLLGKYNSTNNTALKSLFEGALIICLILLERAGTQIQTLGYVDVYASERMSEVSTSMPSG
jgi:hypothetical protein